MGLFVVEKDGKKIVGKKNKFIADYNDLPTDEELGIEQEVQEELIHEKPVVYEAPKRGLFRKKEKTQIEKKKEIVEESPQEEKASRIVDKTSSLDNYVANDDHYLNNIKYANNDVIIKEEDTSQYKGKLKTESTIFGICFKSILLSYLFLVILAGVIIIGYYVLQRYGLIHFELFPYQETYTVKEFNQYNMKMMGVLALVTVIVSLFVLIAVRWSVQSGLRKKYLSKTNIYIYDVFMIILNILFFVLIIMAMFQMLDNYHEQFELLVQLGKIDGPVNTETIVHFKMFVVIISSMVLAISAYFDVDLIHRKNKFVFDDSVF